MRVSDLKKEMDDQFAHVREQFAQVDERFARLEKQIAAEGERTRRHMDIAVEHFKAGVRLLYDKQAAVDETIASNLQEHDTFNRALDDHEVRLKALERPKQ